MSHSLGTTCSVSVGGACWMAATTRLYGMPATDMPFTDSSRSPFCRPAKWAGPYGRTSLTNTVSIGCTSCRAADAVSAGDGATTAADAGVVDDWWWCG